MQGRNRESGLPRWELARYALSDLKFRPVMTGLSVSTIVVAVVYALGLGFYGLSLYRYQSGLLADTLTKRVVATCSEVTDLSHRFTEDKIERMRQDPEITVVFPWRQLGVKLANGMQVLDATAETTAPDDPAVAAERLAWGGPVSTSRAREIVIPRWLFEKLGGSMGPSGPEPAQLELRVSRVTDGKPEVQSIPVKVSGIVRHGSRDVVFLPLGLLDNLNLWCEHKVSSIPSTDGHLELPKLAIDAAVAFGPAEQQGRVGREASELGVAFEPAGKLTVLESRGDPWGRIVGLKPGTTLETIRAALAGDLEVALNQSQMLGGGPDGNGPRIVAMAADDPRWKLVPGGRVPPLGHLLSARPVPRGRATVGGLDLTIDGMVPDFERAGDYFCSSTTIRLLKFEPSTSPVVRRMTLVETQDPRLASRNAALAQGELRVSDPITWKLYGVDESAKPALDFFNPGNLGLGLEPPLDRPVGGAQRQFARVPAPRDDPGGRPVVELEPGAGRREPSPSSRAQEIRDALRQAYPGAEVEFVFSGRVEFDDSREIDVRFLASGLFRHLSGTSRIDRSRDLIPCVAFGSPRVRGRLASKSLDIVASLPGERPELWFDASDREAISSRSIVTGVAIWGQWRELLGEGRREPAPPPFAHLVTANGPPRFSWLAPITVSELTPRLDRDASYHLTPVWAVERVRLQFGDRDKDAVCITPAEEDSSFRIFDGSALAGDMDSTSGPVRLPGYEADSPTIAVRRDDRLPRGLIALPRSVFHRLAVEAENAQGRPMVVGEPEYIVQAAAPRWARLRRAIESRGMKLEPLSPMVERSLIEYRVKAQENSGRVLDDGRVKAISMAQPTFVAALPDLRTSAFLDEQEEATALQGSTAADPARFRHDLKFGRWLSPREEVYEVVIPASIAREIADRRNEALAVDRTITATFRSDRGLDLILSLPLKVVGVVDGPVGYTSLKLAREVTLWRDGKVVYDGNRKVFETPAIASLRGGWLGCNIYLRDDESVEAAVDRLEREGYRTQHHLGEQQGLQKLGRVLILLILLFVMGFVTSAVISVLITNAMNIASKTHEIGILRAHGLGGTQIASIFAVQGMACGIAAFACGSLFIVALEPWLTVQLKATFRIPPESIPVHLASPGNWPLFLISCVVAIAAASFGALLPALKACQLTPVQAMRRAE